MNDSAEDTEGSCLNSSHYESLEEVHVILVLVFLGILNVAVIGGNLLVIASIFISSKLRTVTNFFIVSLAVADLCLGLVVLPYSISLEILDVWIFGDIWCQIWLAVDVWMCTASILNLCAISIDRYVAITRPVHYRSLMSSRRAKILIAAVWVLSFIICFPPLVGWNDQDVPIESDMALNSTAQSALNEPADGSTLLISFDIYPLNSSASNSVDAADSLHILSEFFSSDDAQDNSVVASDEPLYQSNGSVNCECVLINNKGYVIYSALGSFYIPMIIMLFFYWRIYLAALRTSRALARGFLSTKGGSQKDADQNDLTLRMHRGKASENNIISKARRRSGDIIIPRKKPTNVGAANNDRTGGLQRVGAKKYLHFTAYNSSMNGSKDLLEECETVDPTGRRKSNLNRLSKRNIRWHARRFHSEAKATKTVGIIVGGFIFCWLPFFTVYLTRAFCEECISNTLFSIFFWLGYCNSAINPLIYGLFSKDFRQAFKRILCRCFLKNEGVTSLIRQIHMPTFFEEELEET